MYLLQYELGKRRRALIACPKLAIGAEAVRESMDRRDEGKEIFTYRLQLPAE